ncbi:hypothetical protein MTR67_019505 [Solanum verrucosum]|uniref:Pectinesterase inhibitor domain-containing protein n=1 Tax=Solanum verrucosum TaxID=315347 RepID=A0AAF0QPB5_SOLVR|nr:hypothetical protein MTR67_019505 [Solanum verrucosum]
MGRPISSSSSMSLIFLLPYIFLLSVEIFNSNLTANAVTPIIQRACDSSTVKDFCYNVFGNNTMAERARTKYNIEDVTIQMAYSNYSNIARKIVTVTSNETNPEFKQLYKKCLHQYVLLKYDFEYLNSMLIFRGDLDEASQRASTRLQTCINYFYYSPKVSNPFAKDNENLSYFFELIRDIYLTSFD